MKRIERVSLIGLGAVGSVVATRLADSLGDRFTIIADAARQERLRNEGLLFNGRRYDFALTDKDEPKELILIATKASALPEALDAAAPFVGPGTIVLSLLNGIESEETVAARFPKAHVLYSYFLGHPSLREGNRITHDGNFRIYFGEAQNLTLSPEAERVGQLFELAGIPYEIPPDMRSALWQKFVINIGCNQTTALLRSPYGHLQRNDRAMTLAVDLMTEAAAVARAIGIAQADEMVERAVEVIRAMNPDGKSSMLQDAEAGRPTEIDIFAGTLCRLADELRIPVPLNRAALRILSAQ
ncbi:ketopantoate reductase family protein [uncultured Rikenella sp.]|uniref:ketopantoate reductase family protein n=1 Tax=uncultured Rikenella sp. TaxID=368003 RepID=UPI0025D6079B|nr:ketopantoate reductase family protein [uncultured Rikenella sp.]